MAAVVAPAVEEGLAMTAVTLVVAVAAGRRGKEQRRIRITIELMRLWSRDDAW